MYVERGRMEEKKKSALQKQEKKGKKEKKKKKKRAFAHSKFRKHCLFHCPLPHPPMFVFIMCTSLKHLHFI